MAQAPPEPAKLAVEEVPCPLCDAARGRRPSTQLGGFGVVKCGPCGLARLSPRLTADAARRLYEGTYYAAGGYDGYVETFERFRNIYEKLFATRPALLSRHVSRPGRLLEAGCAHGFQLGWLRRQGWEVVGNDVSAEAAAYARERFGLEVIEGPLEAAALEPASFDAVNLVDIVEHLYDAAAALAIVRAALKPGGVILVQVPSELYHREKSGQALWERKSRGPSRRMRSPTTSHSSRRGR